MNPDDASDGSLSDSERQEPLDASLSQQMSSSVGISPTGIAQRGEASSADGDGGGSGRSGGVAESLSADVDMAVETLGDDMDITTDTLLS